jgi:hypothetical protein
LQVSLLEDSTDEGNSVDRETEVETTAEVVSPSVLLLEISTDDDSVLAVDEVTSSTEVDEGAVDNVIDTSVEEESCESEEVISTLDEKEGL